MNRFNYLKHKDFSLLHICICQLLTIIKLSERCIALLPFSLILLLVNSPCIPPSCTILCKLSLSLLPFSPGWVSLLLLSSCWEVIAKPHTLIARNATAREVCSWWSHTSSAPFSDPITYGLDSSEPGPCCSGSRCRNSPWERLQRRKQPRRLGDSRIQCTPPEATFDRVTAESWPQARAAFLHGRNTREGCDGTTHCPPCCGDRGLGQRSGGLSLPTAV